MRPPLTPEEVNAFQARICDVAEQLFEKHGAEGVTMRQIAVELGYSATAVYRYFENKEAILAAVRAAIFNRFASKLELAAKRHAADARAQAKAVGQAYLRFALAEPQAYRLLFDVNQPDMAKYPALKCAIDRAEVCMTGYVADLIDEGALDGQAVTLGRAFWATTHGLVMLHLSGNTGTKDDLVEMHAQVMRLLFKAAKTA